MDQQSKWQDLEEGALGDLVLTRVFQFRGAPLIFLSAPILYAALTAGQAHWSEWIFGGLLCAGAVFLRLLAIRQIGKRARVRLCNPRRLCSSGPFAYTRNPLYLANITMVAGLALGAGCLGHSLTLFALGALCYWPVMKYEESMLEKKLGEEYRIYKQSVPLWFPWKRAYSGGDSAEPVMWREVLWRERGLVPGLTAALAGVLGLRHFNAELRAFAGEFIDVESSLALGLFGSFALVTLCYCLSSELRFRRIRARKMSQRSEEQASMPLESNAVLES